jgi:hypothetical protein
MLERVGTVNDIRDSSETARSVGHGGPFLAFLRKTNLLRDDRRHRARPLVALIVVAWAPIIVLSAASHQLLQVLAHFSIHTRFLVSLPLLFEADLVLHALEAVTISSFAGARVAQGLDPGSLDDLQRRAERLRSSSAGEAACLILALMVGPLSHWGQTGGPSGFIALSPTPLSTAMLWYGWVSSPIFAFLLFRMLWRWLIWCWMLWRISRLDLRLVPTHPDSCGGLGVLVIPVRGFALIVAAVAAAVAGVWLTKIVHHGAALKPFGPPLVTLLAIALLVGLGPLLVFSGKLWRAKLTGRARYGTLAWDYTTQFDERWIVHEQKEGLLGTADLQSLADLANSYGTVRKMRIFPFDKLDALLLGVAVLLPIGPVALTKLPLRSLLKTVAKAVL